MNSLLNNVHIEGMISRTIDVHGVHFFLELRVLSNVRGGNPLDEDEFFDVIVYIPEILRDKFDYEKSYIYEQVVIEGRLDHLPSDVVLSVFRPDLRICIIANSVKFKSELIK